VTGWGGVAGNSRVEEPVHRLSLQSSYQKNKRLHGRVKLGACKGPQIELGGSKNGIQSPQRVPSRSTIVCGQAKSPAGGRRDLMPRRLGTKSFSKKEGPDVHYLISKGREQCTAAPSVEPTPSTPPNGLPYPLVKLGSSDLGEKHLTNQTGGRVPATRRPGF